MCDCELLALTVILRRVALASAQHVLAQVGTGVDDFLARAGEQAALACCYAFNVLLRYFHALKFGNVRLIAYICA